MPILYSTIEDNRGAGDDSGARLRGRHAVRHGWQLVERCLVAALKKALADLQVDDLVELAQLLAETFTAT